MKAIDAKAIHIFTSAGDILFPPFFDNHYIINAKRI
jgi:hypothetical protein